jgi:hypothetical protein
MDTTASSFTLRKKAKRAAEAMIRKAPRAVSDRLENRHIRARSIGC